MTRATRSLLVLVTVLATVALGLTCQPRVVAQSRGEGQCGMNPEWAVKSAEAKPPVVGADESLIEKVVDRRLEKKWPELAKAIETAPIDEDGKLGFAGAGIIAMAIAALVKKLIDLWAMKLVVGWLTAHWYIPAAIVVAQIALAALVAVVVSLIFTPRQK